ncbi:MAG: hypothetical protein D8M59_13140 [Planctomycetes bacterium]|nr:hypothetical protein [Planctomycetota bacterium]NOG54948.1 hypothetical protein [Planctomycetota bacterium]
MHQSDMILRKFASDAVHSHTNPHGGRQLYFDAPTANRILEECGELTAMIGLEAFEVLEDGFLPNCQWVFDESRMDDWPPKYVEWREYVRAVNRRMGSRISEIGQHDTEVMFSIVLFSQDEL